MGAQKWAGYCLLILFTASISAAANVDKRIYTNPPQSTPDYLRKDPAYILASSRMFSREGAQSAYVGLRVMQKGAQLGDVSPTARKAALAAEAQSAADDVRGFQFAGAADSDGFHIAMGLGRTVLSATDPVFGTILGAFLEPSVKWTGSKLFDTAGADLILPPATVQAVLLYMIHEGVDPSSPYGAVTSPALKEFAHLDLASSATWGSPDVQNAMRLGILEERMSEQEKALFEQMKAAPTAEMVSEQVGALAADETHEVTEQMKKWLAEQKTASPEKTTLEKGAAVFGALSGMARIIGNNEAAELLNKFGVLTNIGIQIANAPAFAIAPITVGGLWISGIEAGMEIFASQKNQADIERYKAMMESMKQLFDEMENLRQQLSGQLDIMQRQQMVFFEHSAVTERNIETNVESTRATLNALRGEMRESFHKVQEGVQGIGSMELVTLNDRCQRRVLDHGTFQECRDKLALLASGLVSQYINTDILDPSSPTLNVAIQDEARIASMVMSPNSELASQPQYGHPGNWLTGTGMLLKLFAANPAYKNERNSSGDSPLASRLSLQSLAAVGKANDNAYQTLALTPDHRLRRDQYQRFLTTYRSAAASVISSVNDSRNGIFGLGPVSEDELQKPPPFEKYVFLAQPIGMCPGATPEVLSLRHSVNFVLDVKRKRLADVEAIMQSPARVAISFNENFIPLIPSTWLWMVRSQWNEADISACIAELVYNTWDFDMNNGYANVDVSYKIDLNFTGRVDRHFINNMPFTQLVGRDRFRFTANSVLADPMPIPFVQFWNAQIYSNPRAHISEAMPNDYKESREDLEKMFLADIRGRVQRVDDMAGDYQGVENEKIADSVSALQFITQWGLDPEQPEVEHMLRWLTVENGLPSAKKIADAMSKGHYSTAQMAGFVDSRLKTTSDLLDQLAGREAVLRAPPARCQPRVAKLEALIGK